MKTGCKIATVFAFLLQHSICFVIMLFAVAGCHCGGSKTSHLDKIAMQPLFQQIGWSPPNILNKVVNTYRDIVFETPAVCIFANGFF